MKPLLALLCRALLPVSLLCGSGALHAIDRDLTIAQFQHSSWTAKDGAPLGIWEIEQTQDGWIWLAGPNGLFRFDGIQFERVPVPEDTGTDSPPISRLEAGPADALWIGHFSGGISLLKEGRMQRWGAAEGFDRSKIISIRAVDDGTVWAASRLGVYRFDGRRWSRAGAGWNVVIPVIEQMKFDSNGTLWVFGVDGEIQSLRAGSTRFESTGPVVVHPESMQIIGGAVWEGDDRRFVRMPGSIREPTQVAALRTRHDASIVDRDNNFWTVFCPAGVCRSRYPASVSGNELARLPVEETFTFADGLSSDLGMTLLEDHNGSIWVVTRTGLDRFRRAAMVSVALPRTASNLALAPRTASAITVAAYSPSTNTVWSADRNASPLAAVQNTVVSAIHRDRAGVTWMGSRGGLWRDVSGSWERMPLPKLGPAAGEITSLSSDTHGLLLYIGNAGVFRYADGALTPFASAQPATQTRCVTVDAADRVWIGGVDDHVSVAAPGVAEKVYDASDGIDVGAVSDVAAGQNVLVTGARGVDILVDGRFRRLSLADPEATLGVTGMLQTPDGDVWLNGRRGAVHVSHLELPQLAGPSSTTTPYQLFDILDGYPSSATSIRPRPSLIAGEDGRLWFAGIGGLAWIDPRDTRPDRVDPRVVVRGLSAAGRRFAAADAIDLPEHTSGVDIQFTALGTPLPERTRYRHRMEGADADWTGVDARREAVYTNLGPGRYRFHVRAVDEHDAWRGEETSIAFSIAPAYYQTRAFAALCVLAATAVAWMLVAFALRRSTARTREKMQDRLEERERIARELHDTLLQGMQGLILRIQSIAECIPAHDPSRADMEQALQRADSALIEGRDRVADLRDRSVESQGLARDLSKVGHELARDYSADFRLTVTGDARPLMPKVQTEILKLATEALLNAFRHAEASRIDAAVRFGRWSLVVTVRDNGKGMPPQVLDEGRPGHWGLPGMRERAATIGAALRITSKPAAGTGIELRLRARLAYSRTGTPATEHAGG